MVLGNNGSIAYNIITGISIISFYANTEEYHVYVEAQTSCMPVC